MGKKELFYWEGNSAGCCVGITARGGTRRKRRAVLSPALTGGKSTAPTTLRPLLVPVWGRRRSLGCLAVSLHDSHNFHLLHNTTERPEASLRCVCEQEKEAAPTVLPKVRVPSQQGFPPRPAPGGAAAPSGVRSRSRATIYPAPAGRALRPVPAVTPVTVTASTGAVRETPQPFCPVSKGGELRVWDCHGPSCEHLSSTFQHFLFQSPSLPRSLPRGSHGYVSETG